MTKSGNSINVNFTTVAAAIAGLTVTGVTFHGIDSVPDNAQMLCPVMYPRPDGFISDMIPELETFGSFGSEQMTLRYTMTFRYLHCQIAGGLPGLSIYSALIANVAAIAKAIMNNDTLAGADNVRLKTISRIGPVADPSGNQFHGCDFVIAIEEYT